MAGWEDFKSDAGKIVSKAAVKAGEITDAMAASVRLQGIKLRLCEEYEKLGRLTYRANRGKIDTSADAEGVSAEIDRLRSEMREAERDIKARREASARRARERAEDAEDKEADATGDGDAEKSEA